MLFFVGGINIFQNNCSLPYLHTRRDADILTDFRAVADLHACADDCAVFHLHFTAEGGVFADDAALQQTAFAGPNAGEQHAAQSAAAPSEQNIFPAHRLAARKVQVAVAERGGIPHVAPVPVRGMGADGHAFAQQLGKQVL